MGSSPVRVTSKKESICSPFFAVCFRRTNPLVRKNASVYTRDFFLCRGSHRRWETASPRTGHQQIPKSNIVRFRDFAFWCPHGNGEEHVGSREEKTLFSTTLSESSLLRVSEIPAKRFHLGWLKLTSKKHRNRPVLFCCM